MTSLSRASLALVLALAACGARNSLETGGGGQGGSTGGHGGASSSSSSASSSSSSSGTAGQGGTGGTSPCASLVWAGDRVRVALPADAVQPWLVHTDVQEDTLVSTFSSSVVQIAAVRLGAWWTTWPPPMGGYQMMPGQAEVPEYYTVGRGRQGTFAYAQILDSVQGVRVREVTADGAITLEGIWQSTIGPAQAVARNNAGDTLFAGGYPETPMVEVIPAPLSPSSSAIGVADVACAAPMATVSAVGNGGDDGSFLVAVSTQGTFGTCDPPGVLQAPGVVQVFGVTGLGTLSVGDATMAESSEDLQIVGRIGGGWLAYRAPNDTKLHVIAIDADAKFGADLTVPLDSAAETSSIIAWGTGIARASAERGFTTMPARIRAEVRDGAILAKAVSELPPGTTLDRRPVLIDSDDGRSILVAYVANETNGERALWLQRADCAP